MCKGVCERAHGIRGFGQSASDESGSPVLCSEWAPRMTAKGCGVFIRFAEAFGGWLRADREA